MRKNTYQILFVVAVLQACAGTNQYEGKPSVKLLEGSEQLSLTSEQCPHGMGTIRFYTDTTKANKTFYNATFSPTSEPVPENTNVYALTGDTSSAKPEVKLDKSYNSIGITLIEKSSDGQGLAATAPQTARLNEPIAIMYDSKNKNYHGWGPVEGASLHGLDGRAQVGAVRLNIGDSSKTYLLPDPVLGESNKDSFKKSVKATAGQDLEIALTSRDIGDEGGRILVQVFNGQPGSKGVNYNYVQTEASGNASVKLPMKEIDKGSYGMNVFRSNVYQVDLGEGKVMCVEVSSGVLTRMDVAEAEKK